MWDAIEIRDAVKVTALYTFFTVHYEKDFTPAGDIHSFWEFMYVLDGQVCVLADERVYNLKSGDIIFHKPMELHKFTVTSDEGADILVISFSLTGEVAPFFENKVFFLSPSQKSIIKSLIDYGEGKLKETPCNEVVFRRFLAKELINPVYLQTVALYMNELFLSLVKEGSITYELTTGETNLFKTAVGYMSENLTENPTIKDIAKACNVSSSTLKRLFTKYAGGSIHRYFLGMKLNRAASLLRQGKSVTEVTEILNFSSQSYFSVCFKRETGLSPLSFKKGY